MSSGGGNVLERVTRPVGGLLEDIGVSDESTRGLLTGGITGGLANPSLAIPGALAGQQTGQRIEEARAQAEQEQESGRQQFNEEIFSLAESLQGKIAAQPEFDFESLEFIGSDPREDRLRRLVQAFTQRSDEVFTQRFEPGISQTRLSLVE